MPNPWRRLIRSCPRLIGLQLVLLALVVLALVVAWAALTVPAHPPGYPAPHVAVA